MIKTGIIGIGIMGQNHARVYSEMGILNGIYDIDIDKAKTIAKKFNTKYYRTLEELLNSDIQAVTIATPTITHYDFAKIVVQHKKHMLIEKPLEINFKRANMIYNMVTKAGLVLAVGQIERYNPGVEYIKKAIREKEFGEVINIFARRVSSHPTRIKDVGVILDLGIHDLDIISYLSGSNLKDIYCVGGSTKVMKGGYEDHVIIILKFHNNITGIIETNWLTPMKVRKLSLTCTKKFVELDYINQDIDISSFSFLHSEDENQYSIPYQLDVQRVILNKQEPLKREIFDFINSIKNETQPLVNGNEGVKAVKMADAAKLSLHSGATITYENFNGYD